MKNVNHAAKREQAAKPARREGSISDMEESFMFGGRVDRWGGRPHARPPTRASPVRTGRLQNLCHCLPAGPGGPGTGDNV